MLMARYYEVKGPRLNACTHRILVTAFSFSFIIISVASTSITITPRIRNAAQDEIVNFTCVSNDNRTIILSVTSLRTNIPDFIPPKTATEQSFTFAFVAKENSSVLCIGGFGEQPDASGFLYVQGLLGPVSQLQLIQGRLSWEPPFTLAGVPILSYEVTVNNTALMSTTTTNTTTLDVEHFNLKHCHTYQFTVAPVNSVGTGGNTSVVGIYYNIIENTNVTTAVSQINEMNVNVAFTIQGSIMSTCTVELTTALVCIQQVVTINSTNCYESNFTNDVDLITQASTIIINTTFTVMVTANKKYCAEIFLTNISRLTIDKICFSSFDVQDIHVLNHTRQNNMFCFCVRFITSSTALGCSVHVSYNSAILVIRKESSNTATGCVGVTVGGVYAILVYDWENDGSVSTEPALNETITLDIINPIVPSFRIPTELQPTLTIFSPTLTTNSPTLTTNSPTLDREDTAQITTVLGAVALLFSITTAILLVALISVYVCKLRKRTSTRESVIATETNSAYTFNTLKVSENSAYAITMATEPEYGYIKQNTTT